MSNFNGFGYDFINLYNAHIKPSTFHSADNAKSAYFRRYLLQKVISVFKFNNIPNTWSKDYFLYTLFLFGHIAVINTDKFGVIPQQCSLYGYDVFYRPTHVNIANPLLKGILQPKIGVECEIIKMQPDYLGCFDIVTYYADLLALATESLAMNMINSKLAYVFMAGNKASAESFKKLYDQINEGNPAVFADKHLFQEDGGKSWDTFQNNLKNNYIADDILENMIKIDARFCSEIGIPNVNIAKKSGVTDNEVEANNIDTKTKSELWLETMKADIEKVNKMFDLNITVDFRFKGGEIDDFVNNGNV